MTNPDFEDRLARIKSSPPRSAGGPTAGPGKTGGRFSRLVLALVFVGVGGQLIKIANQNYETIRDQYGILAALGIGLGAIGFMILGITLLFRALWPTPSMPMSSSGYAYPTGATRLPPRTSAGARLFFSLLGMGLGALACLFMYLANAGRQLGIDGKVDAEAARAMMGGSTIAAFLLLALAALIGFVGLFVRRLPMRRVPVFFLLGAMLLFATFRTFEIHPINWPTFMASFSRPFLE
jgi:hypothetical protein